MSSSTCKSSFSPYCRVQISPFLLFSVTCRVISFPYREWDDPSPSSPGTLTCDCSALWLYQWLAAHSVQTSIICAGPREFTGRDIRSLYTASFGCGECCFIALSHFYVQNEEVVCAGHLYTARTSLRYTVYHNVDVDTFFK